MNIFQQLKDIIQFKKELILDDIEEEKQFSPYMTQRWLSFHSPQFALLMNHTVNILWSALDEKSLAYKFFIGIVPKSRYKNIKYIKKSKENANKKTDPEIISHLADRFELSKKEVNEYIDSGLVNIKSLTKQLQD
jgi:hypothetical protein